MLKPDRIPCAILGCCRTFDASKYEPETRVICAKCWRTGRQCDRRLYTKCKRVANRDIGRAGTANRIMNRCWERIFVTATERKVGITA